MSKQQIIRLASAIFDEDSTRQMFIESLESRLNQSSAIIWLRERVDLFHRQTLERAHFQPDFVDRLIPGANPGKTIEHQRGDYYCLDMSSVFAAIPFMSCSQLKEKSSCVIDVCASPGGKSILASRALMPSLLLCNEVIRKRTAQLFSNLKRCAVQNSYLGSADTSILAQNLSGSFDLVIVDAPCSGQSLIAKGVDVPGCFHEQTINMNSNRQKRIIANASRLVSAGGYLAYSTCTFSVKENEKVISWLLKNMPEFEPQEVECLSEFRSTLSSFPCYRLFPHQGFGAGAFTALLRCNSKDRRRDVSRDEVLSKVEGLFRKL